MNSFWYTLRDQYSGSYTRRVLEEAVALLGNLWPYLVAGIVITTFIKLYFSKEQVSSFFNRNKKVSILSAAVIGVISPLGTYALIPMAASLLVVGTPLPVMMALLASSPLIDPNLFILTAGAFGIQLALARVASALLLGLATGFLTHWLMEAGFISENNILRPSSENNLSMSNSPRQEITLRRFLKSLSGMTLYLAKYFSLALILAALIKILTPPGLMIRMVNGNDFLSVLFSAAAGIPFYICGGAAIPVVRELADLGLSHGAVLAFFIAGPVTKISNLVLLNTLFRPRVFLVYVVTGISGAVLIGWLYNFI